MLKTALLLICTMSMLAGCKKMVGLNEIPKADESVQAMNNTDIIAIRALDQAKKIKDLSPQDQDQVADVAHKLIKDPLKFMQSFCHVSGLMMGDKCEEERTECFQEAAKHKDKLTSDKEKIKERIKASNYTVKDILNTMLLLTDTFKEFGQVDCGVNEETMDAAIKKLENKAKNLGINTQDEEESARSLELITEIFIGDEASKAIMGNMAGN